MTGLAFHALTRRIALELSASSRIRIHHAPHAPMDWWTRLLGGTTAPTKPPPKKAVNDPELRLARFKRIYHTVLQLCNRPRNLAAEGPLLEQLHGCLDRIAVLIREETRAPIPHLTLQFAASNQIYNVIARAATVSHDERIISAAVNVMAAMVDSEEEDFVASAAFAKSLMRLVTKIADNGAGVMISVDTETAILELLFTITAKIRLQPEILSFWFHSTAKPELEDVFVKEKKSFVGITQKDDFPLCYLLIDRVHHEGRIGDFARTGLLYIFEATGRSADLEEWVVSSDLPTLMASGLGALYSQLSRELSILHPDATLPAVLAMSDYSTTHPRATAESAFSERHQSHMATFLSYLAFWQDVLDHCRSGEVKQTLLDHFQILFLQQLLYPSLLQSSDTDAGSSVAVLTYMTAMLESLDYPDLMNMMLTYLLDFREAPARISAMPSSPGGRPSAPPRSPTATRRKQSLMLISAPKDPDSAVDPNLFSLVDLIENNISSKNSQSVYAALKLTSTLLARQKRFAFGTLLKLQRTDANEVHRTVGALGIEMDKLKELAISLHDHLGLDEAYEGLADDARFAIEAQVPFDAPKDDVILPAKYLLSSHDHFLRNLRTLLRTFFTNSIDVNLALTQAIVSIALCVDIKLDAWLAVDPSSYTFSDEPKSLYKPWQAYLDDEEAAGFKRIQEASRQPLWSDDKAPPLYSTLQQLAHELEIVHVAVPNLGHLISGRKTMLQAASLDAPLITTSDPPSLVNSPTQPSFLNAPRPSRGHSRSSSQSSSARGRNLDATTGLTSPPASSSPTPRRAPAGLEISTSSPPAAKSIFQPPPPETPSTTDVLMKPITFPGVDGGRDGALEERKASLNHVLTNVVVLQEFVLELVAVMQVRAAVLGEREVRIV